MKYFFFDKGNKAKKGIFDLPKDFPALIKLIEKIYVDCSSKSSKKIDKIGLSLAAILDRDRKKILLAPNIGYLSNKDLLGTIKSKLGVKNIFMEHDIHCFLKAELAAGKIASTESVLYVALGAGIGGAFTVNGKIIMGAHGSAGEVGNTIIDIQNRKSLEDLGGSKFIVSQLGVGVFEAEKMALAGSEKAKKAFQTMGKNLGLGLANAVNILDPEIVLIGGGLLATKKFWLKEFKLSLNKNIISPKAKNIKIKTSSLGRFGGAMGSLL